MMRPHCRSLNTDRFLHSAVDNGAPSAPPLMSDEKKTDNGRNDAEIQVNTEEDTTCCYSHTCCGVDDCCIGQVKWDPKTKYIFINYTAVFIHFICMSAIIYLDTRFHRIPKEYAFVSPIVQLHWTNHALIKVDDTSTICSEVSDSPHFKSTTPSSPARALNLFPPRTAYPNFLEPLFDFTNTTLIEYNHPGNELHLNWMMTLFSCYRLFSSPYTGQS